MLGVVDPGQTNFNFSRQIPPKNLIFQAKIFEWPVLSHLLLSFHLSRQNFSHLQLHFVQKLLHFFSKLATLKHFLYMMRYNISLPPAQNLGIAIRSGLTPMLMMA